MKITDTHVFFWDGIYSNWYHSPISMPQGNFNCVEQFFMYQKASFFGDDVIAARVMLTQSPRNQKDLGKKVQGFDAARWLAACQDVIYPGVLAKFVQHEVLRNQLLREGQGRHFVEASPYDVVWGVGLGENDPLILDPSNWRGKNFLGILIDRAYAELSEQ